jgi:hydrogenase maturation protease
MSEAAASLLAVLAQSTCLVGMGNPFRNDDGVGAHVARRLIGHAGLPPHLQVVDVEDVIESYAFDIADRAVRNVVLVDAAMSPGAPAGSIVFGKVDELEAVTCEASTHKLALDTVASVFQRSGKDTYLLGIVPANIDFGNEMSPLVLAAADAIVGLVCSASPDDGGRRDEPGSAGSQGDVRWVG